jgi:hypothetical protein
MRVDVFALADFQRDFGQLEISVFDAADFGGDFALQPALVDLFGVGVVGSRPEEEVVGVTRLPRPGSAHLRPIVDIGTVGFSAEEIDGLIGVSLAERVVLVAIVVLVGISFEPVGHVLTDFAALRWKYDGCTIISLRSRITSAFSGMDFRTEKRAFGSSGLVEAGS